MDGPRRSIRRPSYAVCASLLAVVLACSGSALAAKATSYTGAQIRNESLTTKDVQNGALTSLDFPAGRIGGTGPDGPEGAQGATGVKGATGTKGATGLSGDDAERQFSHSYREADMRFVTVINPNNWFGPWYMRNAVSSLKSPEFLNTSGLIMTDLTQAQQSGGVLNLPRTSDVVVTATITLAHRGDAYCDDDGSPLPTINMNHPSSDLISCGSGALMTPAEDDDVNTHTRVECWVEHAKADGSAPTLMGERLYASSQETYGLVNIPLTAGITLTPGSYTFRTLCRMADRTTDSQNDDWEFVHANMTALAAADQPGS